MRIACYASPFNRAAEKTIQVRRGIKEELCMRAMARGVERLSGRPCVSVRARDRPRRRN